MSKYEKLYQKALSSPNNFRFDDLCRLAESAGFEFVKTEGSHKLYKHDSYPNRMNFQNKNGNAKPYQVQQLLAFIENVKKNEVQNV